MAKFSGANLRYDNSDESNRTYDITAEVVMNNGVVDSIQSIQIAKDGVNMGYGSMGNISSGNAYSSFNINNSTPDSHKAIITAMIDFAMSAKAKAEQDYNADTTV